MKKAYTKPSIEMETFSPNEYIAACYALVDQNDPANFVIKGNIADGKGTDGQNFSKDGKYYWNGKGFEDDHLDVLSHSWGEQYDGSSDKVTYYNGTDMNLTSTVSAWEANGDSKRGEKLQTYQATPVNIITITEGNAATYNTSVNAS